MRTEDIVERISNAIFQHRLLPGAKLSERDLGEVFNVSRTLIRQALIRLEKDNLVTIEPNRGAFVSRPTLEEAHCLFEALILIEKGFVEAIAPIITEKQIQILRAHCDRQEKAEAENNHQLANELGIQFHLVLAGILHNPVLEKIHRELMSRERIITAIFKTDFDYCRLHHDHRAIIDHLESGSVKRAQKVLESHYRLVVKGYHLDNVSPGDVDLASALADQGSV